VPNVLYRGIPGAGTTTTLNALCTMSSPPIPPRQHRSVLAQGPMELGWRRGRDIEKVRVMQAYFANIRRPLHGLLESPPPVPVWVRDGWRALAEFYRVVDGIVLVVADRSIERAASRAAIIEDVELLTGDLFDARRDVGSIPLVVQLNKSDKHGDVDAVRTELFWPGGLVAVVPSVATEKRGLREALDALLDVL
jgi:hypothetical protein